MAALCPENAYKLPVGIDASYKPVSVVVRDSDSVPLNSAGEMISVCLSVRVMHHGHAADPMTFLLNSCLDCGSHPRSSPCA